MNPEFYEDEVIEGFYVPSMIKKAWAAQMDVLAETDRICREHDIPYFADWGTLLATIRHSGYIPWDDDLDISMRRRDYERFLKFAETELPEGFKVMTYKNHPGHHFFVARIVGKPRICFEQDHLTRFHGFPYIAGIDLFILDNVCKDRKKEKLKAKKAEYVVTVADNIADGITKGREAEEQLKQCEIYTGRKIDRHLSGEKLRVKMYELVEQLFSSIPDEDSDALVQMMPFGLYGNERYVPKEFYRQTVRLPYENTTMSVPLCYDSVMRFKFGNYMHIQKKWGGHDYPFFKGQHEQLLETLDFEYPAYKASREDIVSVKEPAAGSEEKDVKDIVFIPFSPKYWKYMEKMYMKYADDEDARVWVVPIPYYYKAWDGSPDEEVFDTKGYPSDLFLQDYSQVDLQSFHPDVIVIQYPFDEWNSTYTIPAEYYSSNLKRCTDRLIYIPFFVTDDFRKEQEREYRNMDDYVCMPGVINADRIILPTDVLKKTYSEKIMEFTDCCDDDIKQALDEKIMVCPEYVYTNDDTHRGDTCAGEVKSRKTIVYFLTVSFLAEHGSKAVEKINKNLEIFRENSDKVKIIWVTQCIKDNIDMLDKTVSDDFRKAVDSFRKMQIGEYVEDIPPEENDLYARDCDAYYGDPSSLALAFFYSRKPVMIENAEV